jgi:hypothetical protein
MMLQQLIIFTTQPSTILTCYPFFGCKGSAIIDGGKIKLKGWQEQLDQP